MQISTKLTALQQDWQKKKNSNYYNQKWKYRHYYQSCWNTNGHKNSINNNLPTKLDLRCRWNGKITRNTKPTNTTSKEKEKQNRPVTSKKIESIIKN